MDRHGEENICDGKTDFFPEDCGTDTDLLHCKQGCSHICIWVKLKYLRIVPNNKGKIYPKHYYHDYHSNGTNIGM